MVGSNDGTFVFVMHTDQKTKKLVNKKKLFNKKKWVNFSLIQTSENRFQFDTDWLK